MVIAASIAVGVVAFLHIAFFVMESVLWTTPQVRRVFGMGAEEANTTRILALNQGGYNLGVAGLLIWFQWSQNPAGVSATLLFIVAMGLVGGFTASRGIIVVQSVPAAAAFALVWMTG